MCCHHVNTPVEDVSRASLSCRAAQRKKNSIQQIKTVTFCDVRRGPRGSIKALCSHYSDNCTSLLFRRSHHYLIKKRNLYVNQPICTLQEEVTGQPVNRFLKITVDGKPPLARFPPFSLLSQLSKEIKMSLNPSLL